MDVRRFARGTVEWDRLEAVARELAERLGREQIHVKFMEADNWLSIPMVVDDEFFVKVISAQNSLLHALFTSARNLGAVTSGSPGFFDHNRNPLEMAEHEFRATQRMRTVGINAPEPLDAFEVDDLGVLVVEYLDGFRTLESLSTRELQAVADDFFATLRTLHDNGIVHGDLRGENVLLWDGELYFIDATTVRADVEAIETRTLEDPEAYDLACALGMLAPRLGAREAVELAAAHYDHDSLLQALEFLNFVKLRPDHDFDAAEVRLEIERAAA